MSPGQSPGEVLGAGRSLWEAWGQEGTGCFWERMGGHRGLRGQRGGGGQKSLVGLVPSRGQWEAIGFQGDRRYDWVPVLSEAPSAAWEVEAGRGGEQEALSGALAAFQEGGGGVWSVEAAGRVCGAAGPGAG